MNYGQKALHEIKEKNNFTQIQLAESLGTSQTNVSNFLKGKVSISAPIATKMSEKFGYDYRKIIFGDKFSEFLEEGRNVEDLPSPMDQLNKIKAKKSEEKNQNKIVPQGEIISIKTFVIPIKGFSGLKNAFYDDTYISENFEQTVTEVPQHLYSPVSYKIQSSGDSMPYAIPNGAWVTAVPVPEMMWLNYKFVENKVYVLFHPYRGILFKYVKNIGDDKILLSSQNEDKNEYPDEKFDLTEFRKILLAIKVETFI